jgi:S1-C subfamily serine protease
MKTKKLLIFFLIFFVTISFVGCDYIFTFNDTYVTESSQTTLPVKLNGTITFGDSDYNSLPNYSSPTYNIDDIEDYNLILNQTKDHIRRANVVIKTTLYVLKYPYPWSDELEEFPVSANNGSGFIFMEDENDYYAITNFHVVDPKENNARYTIQAFEDLTTYEANLVAYDEDLDLAVIKFPKNDREQVEIIDIYERLYYHFNSAELVMAIGNPLGLAFNVTFGEYKSLENIENYDFKVIYHDATINEGSSGGALVDVNGNLLGVNTWGSETNDEYSFAIPNYIVYTFLVNKGVLD